MPWGQAASSRSVYRFAVQPKIRSISSHRSKIKASEAQKQAFVPIFCGTNAHSFYSALQQSLADRAANALCFSVCRKEPKWAPSCLGGKSSGVFPQVQNALFRCPLGFESLRLVIFMAASRLAIISTAGQPPSRTGSSNRSFGFRRFVLGKNHNQAILDFLEVPSTFRWWRNVDTGKTLLSYGVIPPQFDDEKAFAEARKRLPIPPDT